MGNQIKIVKIEAAKFRIFRPDCKKDSVINLDFNPLIQEHSLKELATNFVLVHFQGIPFGLREWGAYDSRSDNYFSYRSNLFTCSDPDALARHRPIDIDETIHLIRPSAVFLYYGSYLKNENNKLKLVSES